VTYSIELAGEAEADLEGLHKADKRIFNRVLSKIDILSENPLEGNPLVGNHKGEYSLRVGNYRVIYELHNEKHKVYILTVKHRKHVYCVLHSSYFARPKTLWWTSSIGRLVKKMMPLS